jgi:hypothetical protein
MYDLSETLDERTKLRQTHSGLLSTYKFHESLIFTDNQKKIHGKKIVCSLITFFWFKANTFFSCTLSDYLMFRNLQPALGATQVWPSPTGSSWTHIFCRLMLSRTQSFRADNVWRWSLKGSSISTFKENM